MQLSNQADTIKTLQETNNALSARVLALEGEALAAPEVVRAKMEGQLAEMKKQLDEAHEDLERMAIAEQGQKLALLDELNSVQGENTRLRDQLRAKK